MIFRFGVFEFDDETKELRKNGRATPIEPQPAKALALLLSRAAAGGGARPNEGGGARPNEIVSREELRDAVWGKDTHVDFDRGLAYCLSQIRIALGDSGDNPRFVQTMPRRGVKFIAPVASETGETGKASAPTAAAPRPTHWVSIPLTLLGLAVAILFAVIFLSDAPAFENQDVTIAVSVFDNETENSEFDRLIAGLSDLVVERLTKLDPERIAVIGNAAVLRQPRNIRNLKAVAQSLNADYVLLGQLQKGETGLRFITHLIRLRDEAHLKANRLTMADGGVSGLEAAVVDEFERAVKDHVLNRPAN